MYDLALVVSRSEIVKIDDLLDVDLHVAYHLELDIRLKESSRNLVQAFVEDLLVDDCGIAHLL